MDGDIVGLENVLRVAGVDNVPGYGIRLDDARVVESQLKGGDRRCRNRDVIFVLEGGGVDGGSVLINPEGGRRHD